MSQDEQPRASPRRLLAGTRDLRVDDRLVDRLAVAGERPLPGANRIRMLPERRQGIAQVILHDGVRRQLRGGLGEVLPRLLMAAELEIGPAQAIEIRSVAGIDRERATNQR